MSKLSRLRAPSVLCGVPLVVSQAAWAALGATADTVSTDQARMHATRRLDSHPGYEVHELTLGSGTAIREFVAPSGVVFGVAWQGPVKPDLGVLLGEHFGRLDAAARSPHRDHRMLTVNAADLVIESSGKMRAFAGRAYLPDLLPAGVAAGDIQ